MYKGGIPSTAAYTNTKARKAGGGSYPVCPENCFTGIEI